MVFGNSLIINNMKKSLLFISAVSLLFAGCAKEMGGAIEPEEKATVVQEVPAGHFGDFILENCEKVLLKINTSEHNNDITLKYDGDSHLPANLEIQVVGGTFDKKVSGNLPYTHVDYIKGDIANVEITTSSSTFNIVYPATISEKLIVTGGNVVLKGATVKAIDVAEGATADGENPVRIEMEKFTPEGGTEQTPAVTEKIVAKADVVVASEEGVSVTVNAEGDAKIETEGEGEVIDDSNSKDGPLPGVFSVSATKKVRFSPGNLYVKKDDSGNWNLNFYDEQYACNSLNSTLTWDTKTKRSISKDDNESDLFSWGYGDWSKSLYSPSFYVKGYDNPDNDCEQFSKTEDWGYAFGGESSVWRTLNVYEWEYLFGKSTERSGKYKCGVTVCGHPNCVVLLPDVWDETVISLTDFTNTTEYSETTAPKWSAMEAAGAVCLPSAGYSTGAQVLGVELYCAYWTSSGTSEVALWGEPSGEDFDLAHYLWIAKGKVYFYDGSERMQGNSVRLVTDVPAK